MKKYYATILPSYSLKSIIEFTRLKVYKQKENLENELKILRERMTLNKKLADTEHDDINKRISTKTGVAKIVENVFRKLGNMAFFLLMIPIITICVFCLAVALTPGMVLLQWIGPHIVDYSLFVKSFFYASCVAFGFLAFIVTLIFIVPVMNYPIIPFVKPYRGAWFSIESIPWYYHNALTYLVRY
jgi:hypothetical protein